VQSIAETPLSLVDRTCGSMAAMVKEIAAPREFYRSIRLFEAPNLLTPESQPK
jgi:hypothetical protein